MCPPAFCTSNRKMGDSSHPVTTRPTQKGSRNQRAPMTEPNRMRAPLWAHRTQQRGPLGVPSTAKSWKSVPSLREIRQGARAAGMEHLAQRSERSVPPNHRATLLGNKGPIIQRAYIQSVLRLRGQDPPHLFYRCPLVLSHMGSEDQTPQLPAALEGTTEQTLCLMPPLTSLAPSLRQ